MWYTWHTLSQDSYINYHNHYSRYMHERSSGMYDCGAVGKSFIEKVHINSINMKEVNFTLFNVSKKICNGSLYDLKICSMQSWLVDHERNTIIPIYFIILEESSSSQLVGVYSCHSGHLEYENDQYCFWLRSQHK